jgi:multisubunit Na+/H+ antiporter MnhB subunit
VSTIVIRSIAALLLPPTAILGLAVLVKGYTDTGDGFAGGGIVALGVLLQYVAFGAVEVRRRLPVHRAPQLSLVGLAIALTVAFAPLLRGDPLLTHSPPPGVSPVKVGSLELITAVAFDVGVFLLVIGVTVAVIDAVAAAREETLA